LTEHGDAERRGKERKGRGKGEEKQPRLRLCTGDDDWSCTWKSSPHHQPKDAWMERARATPLLTPPSDLYPDFALFANFASLIISIP
jgi:hypothetical protein